MGLAIGVGVLAYLQKNDSEGAEWMQKSIEGLNRVLKKNGLKPHKEPTTVKPANRSSVTSYPYSFLHYLRRAYVCVIEKTPMRTGERTPEDDDRIMEATVSLMDSHLLSHSDCEGYYVPQPFRDPICDNDVPGGFVGSTQSLLKELLLVAPAIGVKYTKTGKLARGEKAKLENINDGNDPLWREKIVWFSLYEAAHYSIENKTLIVFH